METVKAVMALGYTTGKPSEAKATGLDEKKEFLRVLLSLLKSPMKVDAAELLRIWQTRDDEAWSQEPEIYQTLDRRFLEAGEPLMAHDVAREGRASFPGDQALAQVAALTLARSGATLEANAILEGLRPSGHYDEETTGLLARTH